MCKVFSSSLFCFSLFVPGGCSEIVILLACLPAILCCVLRTRNHTKNKKKKKKTTQCIFIPETLEDLERISSARPSTLIVCSSQQIKFIQLLITSL